jgi:hypothetical protein
VNTGFNGKLKLSNDCKTLGYKTIALNFIVIVLLSAIFYLDVECCVDALKYISIAVFTYVFYSIRRVGTEYHEPIFIFLFLFVIFLLNKVILEIFFDFGSVSDVGFFVENNFDSLIVTKVLSLLIISMIGIHIGYIASFKRLGFIAQNFYVSKRGAKFIFAMIFLTFPIVLNYYYNIMQYVVSNGYLAYHRGEVVPKSFSIFASEQFFWIGVSLYLASIPKMRNFLFLLLCLILPMLVMMIISGKRGIPISILLSMIWYFHQAYHVKFRILIYLILTPAISIFLLMVGVMRHGRTFEESQSNIAELLLMFFNQQAASLNTLIYSVAFQSDNALSDYSLWSFFADGTIFLDKIYRRIFGMKELSLEEKMQNYEYSGYLITNALDNSLLTEGMSTGTSYITELYLIGSILGVVAGSIILGYFFGKVRSIIQSYFGFFAMILLIPSIVYLTRMSFGSVIVGNIFIIFFFIYTILKKLNLKDRNDNRLQ